MHFFALEIFLFSKFSLYLILLKSALIPYISSFSEKIFAFIVMFMFSSPLDAIFLFISVEIVLSLSRFICSKKFSCIPTFCSRSVDKSTSFLTIFGKGKIMTSKMTNEKTTLMYLFICPSGKTNSDKTLKSTTDAIDKSHDETTLIFAP